MKRILGFVFAGSAVFAVSACSGGAREGSLPATSPGGPSHRTTHARLLIKVPPQKHHKKIRVHGHYISPATASLTYTVTPALQGGATTGEVDINTSNPNCTVTGVVGYLSCSIDISGIVPSTPYTFSFTTYDAAGGTGNILSANDNVPFTATPGTSNVLAATLGGVASALVVTPVTPYRIMGSGTALTVYGNHTVKFAVTPIDAQDNYIIGPGAPQPVASLAPGANATVAAVGTTSPNEWALTSTYQPTDPANVSATMLSVSATPVPGSGGSTVSATIPLKLYQPWVYVSDDSANTITVYDEDGNVKTPSGGFPSLNAPAGMAYDPNNGWLYVADFGGDVRAYDRVGNLMLVIPTSPSSATDSVAFDSNNRWLYVIGYNGSGAAYDEQGNLQTTAGGFPGLHQARQIAFYPGTHQLYVANNNASNVVVYDETGTPVTPSGGFPNLPPQNTTGISYDPIHAWLWVTDGQKLAAYDGDGNSTVPTSQVMAHTDQVFNLTFDQYDGFLYLTNRGAKTVTVYDQQANEYVLPNPMVGFSDPLSVAVVK